MTLRLVFALFAVAFVPPLAAQIQQPTTNVADVSNVETVICGGRSDTAPATDWGNYHDVQRLGSSPTSLQQSPVIPSSYRC